MYWKKDAERLSDLARFHSSIKRTAIRREPVAMDLGSGRLHDLFKWSGIGYMIAIERDPEAYEEGRKVAEASYHATLTIDYIRADLTKPEHIDRLISSVPKIWSVYCFFAIHYFTGQKEDFDQIVRLIQAKLRPGGRFCFTCFSAEKIQALPKEINFGNQYYIKKKYDDQKPGFGRKIGVYISSIGYEHDEFLVYSETIREAFPGFKITRKNFSQFPRAPENEHDRAFSFLNDLWILIKPA